MSGPKWRVRGVSIVVALVVALPVALGAGTPVSAGTNDPYLADEVPRAAGCIVLGRAWAGVKVAMVQRRLGTTHELDRYGSDTLSAVAAFQGRRDLRITGKVNRSTWKALGFSKPFCIDRFTVQPSVSAPTGARKRVEAMITWARTQVGRSYIWGGAGPIGYDCSGLVLQALYAGGRVIPSVDTYRHQRRDFATAAAIYDSGMKRVPLDQRRRGDLVFYGPEGSTTHMAIYLGKGRVLEAVRPQVRRSAIGGHGVPLKPRVVRPFGR
ncbi:MAG TPA: NlpC/P60 family protein [Actinomycetes bacterium]|nr:NlpC/P60 family protein [Actinomycetes bacterium]